MPRKGYICYTWYPSEGAQAALVGVPRKQWKTLIDDLVINRVAHPAVTERAGRGKSRLNRISRGKSTDESKSKDA